MKKLGAVVVMCGNLILGDYYYKDGKEKTVAKQKAERKMHELKKEHEGLFIGYMETERDNIFS